VGEKRTSMVEETNLHKRRRRDLHFGGGRDLHGGGGGEPEI